MLCQGGDFGHSSAVLPRAGAFSKEKPALDPKLAAWTRATSPAASSHRHFGGAFFRIALTPQKERGRGERDASNLTWGDRVMGRGRVTCKGRGKEVN